MSEQPAGKPPDPPTKDRAAIGCLAFAAILVVGALVYLVVHRGDWSDDVDRLLYRPTPTPFILTSSNQPSDEVALCPTQEPLTCQDRREAEQDIIAVYRAAVIPVTGDLLDVAATYETLSRAMALDRLATMEDDAWRMTAREAEEKLEAAEASLATLGIPGSIAGTHVRLVLAAMFLDRCVSDVEFYRGASISGSRIDLGAGPLECVDKGYLDYARVEILHAIGDLGGGV